MEKTCKLKNTNVNNDQLHKQEKEKNINLSSKLTVDTTMGTVSTAAHLSGTLDNDVLDDKTIDIKTLDFSVALSIAKNKKSIKLVENMKA